MDRLVVKIESDRKDGFAHVSNGSGRETWAKGYAFLGRTLLRSEDLAYETLNQGERIHRSPREFLSWVNGLNGCFCLVTILDGQVAAAVDRIRSRPLFYSRHGSNLVIGDDPYWIKEWIGCEAIDPAARQDYLLTGYVTGADTLCPNIKQLQAGEALIANPVDDGWRIVTERYYLFRHLAISRDKAGLNERLDQVFRAIFERLLEYASGRIILIPLSGGYDSRLIVMMLRQLGYENMVAFSFGQRGNEESEISKRVARMMSLPWHFVEYTNEKWHQWYRSAEMRTFLATCDGLSAFPYISTWPAIGVLRAKGLVPDDAILVPGHSLDFIAGGHIPKRFFFNTGQVRLGDVLGEIIKRHYNMWIGTGQFRRFHIEGAPAYQRLRAAFPGYDDPLSREEAASLFEMWDWQERQAKAIVNTARIYEYWGYDWYLPFWDQELIEFWETVPLESRIERAFCKKYIADLSCAMLGGDVLFANGRSVSPWRAMNRPGVSEAIRSAVRGAVRPIRSFVRRAVEIWPLSIQVRARQYELCLRDKWALYGILTKDDFFRYRAWRVLPHAFWVWDKLGEVDLAHDGEEAGRWP